MVSGIAEVERALLALAPDERAAVIERGLLSLDDVDDSAQDDIDAAWSAELDRRMRAYTSGEATLVDVDEHLARIRSRLSPTDR